MTPVRVKHPATPKELGEIAEKLTESARSIMWVMATTGMRVNEYWGSWKVESDRVTIRGTKTKGATRDVPNVLGAPSAPAMSYKEFRAALAAATGTQMTPYDLRRT